MMVVLICQAVFAQQKTVEEITEMKVNKLEAHVVLSEVQKNEITEIILRSTAERKTLRSEQEANHKKMKALKMAEKSKIEKVLTEEQIEKLDSYLHSRNQKPHKPSKEMHLKRVEFDKRLTAAEKERIEKARLLRPHKGHVVMKDLTEKEKKEHRRQNSEIKSLLSPIVESHRAELEKIMASMTTRHQTKHPNAKPDADRKFYRFLLMK